MRATSRPTSARRAPASGSRRSRAARWSRSISSRVARRSGAGELANEAQQHARLVRLADVVLEAGGARLLAVRLGGAPGDGDEHGPRAAVALAQRACDVVAAHLRHAD